MTYESDRDALGDHFAQKQILVTGGGGFIGSHLVRRLVSLGTAVTSLGSNRGEAEVINGARYVFGDVSKETLETVECVPDLVFHLAGGSSVSASVEDPPQDFLKTVFSTVQLLDFVRRDWPNTKVVYVSSAAIYGEANHTAARGNFSCLPVSPYGMHKRQAELLLLNHGRIYETASVIVRPFSVYGPGLKKQLLWDALRKAKKGVYEFFGSGREVRDWVFVSDLVKCLLLASRLASQDVPILNAGTRRGVTVREILVQLFEAATIDREPIFIGRSKSGDPDSLVAEDCAEDCLGPLFETPLRDGLTKYVEWYRGWSALHD